MKHVIILLLISAIGLLSCKNHDVNYNDGPNFSEIHEDIHYHFDKIAIDGSEYFILERDRNNPHEGFGFMALKGSDFKNNQDTIKAYLKTVLDFQVKIMSRLDNKTEESTAEYADKLYQYYMNISKSPYYIQEEKE